MAVIEAEGRQYLEQNFAPVGEERTVTDLEVTGSIPADIAGRYVRIGPNPWPVPEGAYHWFTGTGMVHGVELRDGKAQWYRNRWIRTPEQAERLGEPAPTGPLPLMYDGANTNVLGHAGRILAMTEGAMPYELTKELDTVGRTDLGGVSGFTAHPKIDPVTGELLGFRYWFDQPFAEFFAIGADGLLTRKVPIDTTGSVMMHDFSVTEHFAVFYDLPVTFRIDLAMDPNVPFPFAWDDEYPARLGVLSRADGEDAVRWFDIDPCYVFHPMNAYEDGDQIVLDVVRYDDMFRREEVKGGLTESGQALDRWTIDLTSGKVAQDRLDDREQEFPQVDPRVVGRRHRIGYSMSASHDDGMLSDGIIKHDLVTGASSRFDAGPGRSPGEASFVPAGAGEDDGYLVTFVYDAATDRSDLVLLDASDMTQVAAVHLPTRVPYGFHGSWIAD
ncbi:MAG TPA: carotenoid oxygenase family protein [Acidimicrobiales bacterium]|nr:carotenoid oxygenase family protein [Acidimicrobiales bacterium]